jgi:NADH-quinone oxidoreductase subunit F
MGISYETPFVEIVVSEGNVFHYGRVGPRDVGSILSRHFKPSGMHRRIKATGYRLLERLYTDEMWEPITRYSVDLNNGPESLYWGRQHHIVTQHCGTLDPLDFDGYREHKGFESLKTCLRDLNPSRIIGRVKRSGLRGRGGGGYPTAQKWGEVKKATGIPKYIICNGDEGDPGAFMDRMILESFPFRVIEGMVVASLAVGASHGFLYVRLEYPLAIRRIKEALRLCYENQILGKSVMGSKKAFFLDIIQGAGAFVAGEETALIAAIEGRRGMPRYRPPYPSVSGLFDKPTLVNNVETFANIPWIILHGSEQFARIGTPRSNGTKAFALAGKVIRGGLIEVPMGITLREIVYEVGGGIQRGKKLKAVQVGGPSGGCVPAALCDTPVDYEALVKVGAIMGSGGLVVLDETDCMVDIARYFMKFTQNESCGKCTYCRIGTKCMLEILERLCRGDGRAGDVEDLEYLAAITQRGSLCGLGRTAPNPVQSTVKYFRDEYEAHINGCCPAGKCGELITYSISDDCIGCTRCVQRCPADAISGVPYMKHEIDPEKCLRCGSCIDACRTGAVEVR